MIVIVHSKTGRERADKILETIGLLTDQSDLNVFNHILEIINDFRKESVLGNSTRLRGQLSEALCKFLGIPNETIDQNLQDMSVSAEPDDDIRNIIMQRLINAKYAEFAKKTKPDCETASDEKEILTSENKLPQLRETLHRHISLYLTKEKNWFYNEKHRALDFLAKIDNKEITKESELLKKIRDDYYGEKPICEGSSPLFSYINNGLYEYFKIPKERMCVVIMGHYRGRYQKSLESPTTAAYVADWFTTYNYYIKEMIQACFYKHFNVALEEKQNPPIIPLEKKSLYDILTNKLSGYPKRLTTGKDGHKRYNTLHGIINDLQANEVDLFIAIMEIYQDTSEKLSLKDGPTLKTLLDEAIAEFLGITENQLCVLEFDDCHEKLRNGKTVDFTRLRHDARHKLIDKAVQNYFETASFAIKRIPPSEIKDETSTPSIPEKPSLINALISSIAALETDDKNETLEKIISMAADESKLLNWAYRLSLYGHSKATNLRHTVAKVLCEYVNIKITTTFLEKPPYQSALQHELNQMLLLINEAYIQHLKANEVVLHAAAPG